MYRLPFELTDSAKLLHFTILGGGVVRRPPRPPPLNDAPGRTVLKFVNDVAATKCRVGRT